MATEGDSRQPGQDEGAASTLGRVEEDVTTFQEMLRRLKLQHQETVAGLEARLQQASEGRITFVTQPPLMTPKVKIFTGLPPKTAEETTFADWYPLMRDALEDETVVNKAVFTKRHLGGLLSNTSAASSPMMLS